MNDSDKPFDIDEFEQELINYPGAQALEDADFWQRVSERALNKIWDDPGDDVYDVLLNE